MSLNGDGDFLMNGQEFATAVQYGLPIIADRLRQCELRHDPDAPGARISRAASWRPTSRTRISPPMRGPSAALAPRSSAPRTFPAAFEAAQDSGLPSIIHLKIDADAITPGMTLTQIREQARG